MTKSGNKSRARRSRPRASKPRNLPLLAAVPPTMRVKNTYGFAGSVAESAAGLGGTYFFRANSVYDPDATGVGSTAVGYSTFSALFLNYRVRRVTIRLQGKISGMAATGVGTVVVAPVASQSVVPSNKQTWRMIPFARQRAVGLASDGGKNFVDITTSYDMAQVSRVTKSQFDSDFDFTGQVGSNPARQVFILVAVDSSNSASVATLYFNAQITYEVEWFNPVPLQ